MRKGSEIDVELKKESSPKQSIADHPDTLLLYTSDIINDFIGLNVHKFEHHSVISLFISNINRLADYCNQSNVSWESQLAILEATLKNITIPDDVLEIIFACCSVLDKASRELFSCTEVFDDQEFAIFQQRISKAHNYLLSLFGVYWNLNKEKGEHYHPPKEKQEELVRDFKSALLKLYPLIGKAIAVNNNQSSIGLQKNPFSLDNYYHEDPDKTNYDDFKLIKSSIIGPYQTGKTALLMRYKYGEHLEQMPSSELDLNADFKIKSITVEGTNFKLQVWDFMRNNSRLLEPYPDFRFLKHRAQMIVIITFDTRDRNSFKEITSYLREIECYASKTYPPVVAFVGTFADKKEERSVSKKEIDKFIVKLDNEKSPYFIVSGYYEVCATSSEKKDQELISTIFAESVYYIKNNHPPLRASMKLEVTRALRSTSDITKLNRNLLHAFNQKDLVAFLQALDEGANPNLNTPNGTPLLIQACYSHPDGFAFALLKSQNIDVNATDIYGNNTLMIATCFNRRIILKALLNHPNIDIDQTNKEGYTAFDVLEQKIAEQNRNLLQAFNQKNFVAFLQALNEGTNPNINTPNGTPLLIQACCSHSDDFVLALLKSRNIDVNITDQYGNNALIVATYFNRLIILKALLDNPKVDIDQKNKAGYTALDVVEQKLKAAEINENNQCYIVLKNAYENQPSIALLQHSDIWTSNDGIATWLKPSDLAKLKRVSTWFYHTITDFIYKKILQIEDEDIYLKPKLPIRALRFRLFEAEALETPSNMNDQLPTNSIQVITPNHQYTYEDIKQIYMRRMQHKSHNNATPMLISKPTHHLGYQCTVNSNQVTLDIALDHAYTHEYIKQIWIPRLNLFQSWLLQNTSHQTLLSIVLPDKEVIYSNPLISSLDNAISLSDYLCYEKNNAQNPNRLIFIPYKMGDAWTTLLLHIEDHNLKTAEHIDPTVDSMPAQLLNSLSLASFFRTSESHILQEIQNVYPDYKKIDKYSFLSNNNKAASGPLAVENAIALIRKFYLGSEQFPLTKQLCGDNELARFRGEHRRQLLETQHTPSQMPSNSQEDTERLKHSF